MAEGVPDPKGGHGVDGGLLDPGVRHPGDGGLRCDAGECAACEECVGAKVGCLGLPVDPAAPLVRAAEGGLPTETGDRGGPDAGADTGQSGAGPEPPDPADTKGLYGDEHVASERALGHRGGRAGWRSPERL